jgi:hypothetical protein
MRILHSALGVALLTSVATVIVAAEDNSDIHIRQVTYADNFGKSCDATEFVKKVCENRAQCDFVVGDKLCKVPYGMDSVRNLEAHWTCGLSPEPKARAAANGTKMNISCLPKNEAAATK